MPSSDVSTSLIETFLKQNLIATLILALFLLFIRYFIARYIRQAEKNWTSHQRLRMIGVTRSTVFVVLALGVLYIWGEQIQGFAVSVFAIALAMVMSVKESLICLNGSWIRLRGHLFDIGDRIRVKSFRGDVIDITLLSTTLMEVGKGASNHQYTGRKITIPNSVFIAEPVINESFLDNFYMNNITIPLKVSEDWKGARLLLLQIAQEECAPYIEQARRRIQQIERSRSLELPSVEPRVTIRKADVKTIKLHLRLASPMHLKGRIEQVIVTRFLEQFHGGTS